MAVTENRTEAVHVNGPLDVNVQLEQTIFFLEQYFLEQYRWALIFTTFVIFVVMILSTRRSL